MNSARNVNFKSIPCNDMLRVFMVSGTHLWPLKMPPIVIDASYTPVRCLQPPRVMNLKLWLQFLQFLLANVFSHKISSGENIRKSSALGSPKSETVRFEKKHFCHFELQYLLIDDKNDFFSVIKNNDLTKLRYDEIFFLRIGYP